MTRTLVELAAAADPARLPAEVVHETRRRLVDTFACAIGAWDDPLCAMARGVAARSRGEPAASVWGVAQPASADVAAFANGVMLRYLDLSDMFRVKSGGHPSDVIAAVLAAGESVDARADDILAAIVLAYDVYCGFCEALDFNSLGWDQPVYAVMASAIGAARLFRLSEAQTGDAIALALAPNMALLQTRRGELSAWKGCAAANAARNGVFAALLARDGFTGPTAVFEGKQGLFDIVGRFAWPDTAPHRLLRTHIKCFPVCYHGQSAVQTAIALRPDVPADDIAEVRVDTYHRALDEMASDPTRWAPATRETADHSLPYVVAVALSDGEVTPASFDEARLRDPGLARLMAKVRVVEQADLTAQYPESSPCRITVRLGSGAERSASVRYPAGHEKAPVSDAELDAKFRGLFRGYGDAAQCEAVLGALRGFGGAGSVRDLMRLLVRRPAAGR